jgi:hypothetical protein
MPSLDPIKAKLDALKALAARLIHGHQAPALIIMQPDETRDQAVVRVCGEKGLSRVMMNGLPVPHLIIRPVTPVGKTPGSLTIEPAGGAYVQSTTAEDG